MDFILKEKGSNHNSIYLVELSKMECSFSKYLEDRSARFMTDSYFFEFEILIEKGSFSEAAECLNYSQSALSKHIQKLERELNLKLIERTPHGVKITPAGEKILTYIPPLRKAHDDLEQAILAEQAEFSNSITILSSPFIACYGIYTAIREFTSKHPNMEVKLNEQSFSEEDFINSPYELAFSYFTENMEENFNFVPYRKDHIAIALYASHPLAGQESVRFDQLKNDTFIMSSSSPMLLSLLNQLCSECGFEPNVNLLPSLYYDSLLSMVSYGSGITLMPKEFIRQSNDPNLTYVNLEPLVDKTVFLIWKKTATLSRSAACFVDFIRSLGAESD